MNANNSNCRFCAFPECISQSAPSLRCSQCKIVYYCSLEHQKFHWKIHKRACTSNKNINNSSNSNSSSGIGDETGGGSSSSSSSSSSSTCNSNWIDRETASNTNEEKSESRISRCMFCGESLVLSCEEDAVSHMRICPALQEQLNSEDQFTIPTMLKDKMQPKHGQK